MRPDADRNTASLVLDGIVVGVIKGTPSIDPGNITYTPHNTDSGEDD